MPSWRHCTCAQYGSCLQVQALAAFAQREGAGSIPGALAGLLAERASSGATASALHGITSVKCAVEDLGWFKPTVTQLHRRVAAGAPVSGMQEYLCDADSFSDPPHVCSAQASFIRVSPFGDA